MTNKEIVEKFENEFKNKVNVGIVDSLMSENFQHHAPIPGIPAGREGLKAIGQFVHSLISDIRVKQDIVIEQGNLVANRASGTGIVKKDGRKVSWTENHFYKLENGKIVEWWGEGAPPLQ